MTASFQAEQALDASRLLPHLRHEKGHCHRRRAVQQAAGAMGGSIDATRVAGTGTGRIEHMLCRLRLERSDAAAVGIEHLRLP